ncbi:MAG: hypothetical protein CVV44_19205 [Spirochaetae bacterium HGW-Spirochaetae-1]|nr:MAG: hypothetical protein CVV44_19205 [Spirochaetae bacterium HGW-Spirochaetae-1]
MKGFLKHKRFTMIMAAAAVILMLTGYCLGKISGRSLIRGFILERSRYVMFLFTPARQYFQMLVLVNSDDELQRIAGYYALLDNDLIDEDFLRERFQKESSLAAKRTILWVLGQAGNRKKILEIYAGVYSASGNELRMEILRSMERLDEYFYLEFIKKNRIDPGMLKE